MPTSITDSSAPSAVLEIKSGAVNLPILKLLSADMEQVESQLRDKIDQAPDFFRNAPMAIDLYDLAEREADIDFTYLAQAMRSLDLIPVGIGGGGVRHYQSAQAVGLSQLTFARHETPPASKEAKPKLQPEEATTKIVDTPVRSGQRIYAAGGDLVVLSAVSAGAEVMADGNIHVYGALRGRALAGVQGRLASRIFCHDLQAELVAIGGNYKVSENIDDSVRGVPVQIYLKDNALIIERI
jgi:septum site-determining protein MinC